MFTVYNALMKYERVLLNHIPITLPERVILRRLGYHYKAIPDRNILQQINTYTEEARMLMEPKAVYRQFSITIVNENSFRLDESITLESKALVKLFQNVSIVSILAVTLGDDIVDRINTYMNKESAYAAGVMLDAAASELCEAAAASVHTILVNMGRQKGFETTMRFSPGYKDFSLDAQHTLATLLGLEDIGISVTESCMLLPEKSITALTGWKYKNESS